MSHPKVSVILTARNYAKYLDQAVQSVFKQTFQDFELIIVDDGSTDHTDRLLDAYTAHPQVRIVRLSGVGLAAASNAGIAASRGDYLIRLDADDYFDEHILLVEANYLDAHPPVHMVYPDYYRVDARGGILEHVRLPKVYDEVTLLDRSPLAAGAMFRRWCVEQLGGYDESLRYQEDYDFWIRFVDRFTVYNVNLPLLYYRQHDLNMSRNFEARMDARRAVKEKFVEAKGLRAGKRILGVIPAQARLRGGQKLPLAPLAGQPLLAYTVEEALQAKLLDRVIVSTEDPEVAELAVRLGAEAPFLRPKHLASKSVPVEEVVRDLLLRLSREQSYRPDLVAVLHIHAPLRRAKHIIEGIDTLLLYEADSVLSVCQDLTFHWRRGKEGLEPVGYQRRLLREEKETIFKENGALYVTSAALIEGGDFLGKRISCIEMSPQESLRLETDFDFWVAEQWLARERERVGQQTS
ncbi:MAG: glycosyltransferase [Candidatus Omnitrophica bacterium]|nr:glycosyltransferase [Candidatus Omnitrophota bacterium]